LLGKSVTANEILLSSYAMGVLLLKSDAINITKEQWDFIKSNKNKNSDNFILANYKDTRFSQDECNFIDNFYANVQSIYVEKSTNWFACHALLLQYIMEKCFIGGRLNRGQILAEREHRINHKKNSGKEMSFTKIKPNHLHVSGAESECVHGDACDFFATSKKNFDLLYIDPPYGGQQSDYASMYKFCEEYITRQAISEIDYLQKASKKFIKSKNYLTSFENLLEKLPKNSYWLFSYNDSSWANIDTIKSCLINQQKKVIVKEIDYKYKQRDVDNVVGVEYLIFGV
jgi:hypothetical protein